MIQTVDFSVPWFEGVCPGCGCEGEHAAMCPEWIVLTADRVSREDATQAAEYSESFWCGLPVPPVLFWRAVLSAQKTKGNDR